MGGRDAFHSVADLEEPEDRDAVGSVLTGDFSWAAPVFAAEARPEEFACIVCSLIFNSGYAA